MPAHTALGGRGNVASSRSLLSPAAALGPLSLRMFDLTVFITRRARVEVFGANAIAGGEDHAAGTYVASNGPTGGAGLLTKVDISPNAVEDWFTGGSTVAAIQFSVAGSERCPAR